MDRIAAMAALGFGMLGVPGCTTDAEPEVSALDDGPYCDDQVTDIDMDEVATELGVSGNDLAQVAADHEETLTWRSGSVTVLTIGVSDPHGARLEAQTPAEPEWEGEIECLDQLSIGATLDFATSDGTLLETVDSRIGAHHNGYGEPYTGAAGGMFQLAIEDLGGSGEAFDVEDPTVVLVVMRFEGDASSGTVFVCSAHDEPESPCTEMGTWGSGVLVSSHS